MSKLIRLLEREHPNKTRAGLIAVATGVVVAGIAAVSLPVAAVVFGIALVGGIKAVISEDLDVRIGDGLDIANNKYNSWPDDKIYIGTPADIAKVIKTQKLIEAMTKKYVHLPVLPPNVQKKIDMHIADIEDAALRVRVFQEDIYRRDNQQLPYIFFERSCYDNTGKCEKEVLAKFLVAPSALALPAPRAEVANNYKSPVRKKQIGFFTGLVLAFAKSVNASQDRKEADKIKKLTATVQQLEKKVEELQTVQSAPGLVVRKDRKIAKKA